MAQTVDFIEFVDTTLKIDYPEISGRFVRKKLIVLSTSLWIRSRAERRTHGSARLSVNSMLR